MASAKNLRQFVEDMKSLSDELGKYLIGMECVILDTEFIFFNRNTKRYEFCLLPFFENEYVWRNKKYLRENSGIN